MTDGLNFQKASRWVLRARIVAQLAYATIATVALALAFGRHWITQ